ncbi:MAG: cysteine desulfurase [Chitinophagaceae bacterium]|nr:cysteine desulfurase [Chitinophagaceae bacterium]
MQKIYLDNAATTPVDPLVLEAMLPYFSEKFGNPSSIYSYGRETRMAIERARKSIAEMLHTRPGELFFTSGGTESSNTAIHCAVRDLGCQRIITSPIEHHATLHTVEFLKSLGACTVEYVGLTQNGHVDLVELESLLAGGQVKTLVTLMHANNEVGNLLDLNLVGNLCRQYGAVFHSDTVQTIGHYQFNLEQSPVDFLSASAHKFHGPKGSGLLYIRQDVQIKPFIHGGAQERLMRAGTENVAGIVGFASALELATMHHDEDSVYIRSLKSYMQEKLTEAIPDIRFNGDTGEQSLYTVLSAAFPATEKTEMLSINLDMAGICISGGSACSSGAQGGSHVIKGIYPHESRLPIRFSFSKHNTFAEIDIVVSKIKEFL